MNPQSIRNHLNLSQTAICQSEQACPGSAVNTISVKLSVTGYTTEQMKRAFLSVALASDIFHVSLNINHGTPSFSPCENEASVRVLAKASAADADAYVKRNDALPLSYPGELYRAEIIPIIGGDVLLYVRFHHIIADGYGMSLFAQRVLDALAGKAVPESDFFTEPADAKNQDGASFWQSYFANAEFSPSVFSGQPKGMKIQRREAVLDENISKAIPAYAAAVDSTEAYVLAAAYAVYLSGATGKPEAVFLMPRLNRTAAQMNTIGCDTLLVPVRVKIDPDEPFAQVCRKVKEAAKEASAHKDCGYDGILRALRRENLISDTLSEYVFNYYRFCVSSDIDYRLDISVAGAMRNHLTWNIFKRNEQYRFGYDFRDGVYTEEKMAFFSDAIVGILKSGMKNPAVRDIPLVGGAERKKLSAVKGKPIDFADDETIVSLFRKEANACHTKPAIYSENNELSFGELNLLSDRIACSMVSSGVKPGDRVAFMLKRDIRLIPTMLGILKAGAVFIPIDPAYPKGRISYILENSGAAMLISSADVEAAAKYTYTDVDALIAARSEAALPRLSQRDAAYMIYTSGTTGNPKGVILSHRGIVNIVNPDNNPFNRDMTANGHGITAIGSICFDISLFEIFVPLLNGLFIELGNEKAMLDAGELALHINRHHADILHCTPSRIAAYLNNAKFTQALGSVKMILSAGEVLPGSLISELKNRYGIRIYNGYGPTETTIGATITDAGDEKTIGAPIANMGIVLLNGNLSQAPYGAVGEICVSGAGVGIGYHAREKETNEKFILWNGVRLYKTGDLGSFTDDGRLLYHGRCDRQVKLRGLRIELSEIEKGICSFDGIAQTVCMIRKIGKSEHIAAFYTVSGGRTVNETQLREHLKNHLAAYMVPDILCELAEMPQTPGGKTDAKALLDIPVKGAGAYRAPSNQTEKLICEAFAKALGTDRAGTDDNYFELGGDSLGSVELLLSVEEALGLKENEITYADIYKYPTPALLAERITAQHGGHADETDGYPIETLDYTGMDHYLSEKHGAASGKTGNVLLTGATGYLGVHILADLLKRPGEHGKVFCLARSSERLSAEKRVKSALFYYDENDYSHAYGEGWEVVEGDISTPEIFKAAFPEPIDLIINSAANVSHFAYGDALTRVNVTGVENLIALSLKKQSTLCQVSTISVGGVYPQGRAPLVLTEKDLYIGQKIYNQYIYTKFMAEYRMLRAAVDDGLKIKIMRVGNLQGRSQDGEFQMNMKSNAFTRQLSSYIKMKALPASLYRSGVNFSPVDETAHMIVSLAESDACGEIYHVYPPYEASYAQIVESLAKLGHSLRVVPDREFEELLLALKHREDGKETVKGLLTERPDERYLYASVKQERTNERLNRLGEKWKPFTADYLEKYLSALDGMDMF